MTTELTTYEMPARNARNARKALEAAIEAAAAKISAQKTAEADAAQARRQRIEDAARASVAEYLGDLWAMFEPFAVFTFNHQSADSAQRCTVDAAPLNMLPIVFTIDVRIPYWNPEIVIASVGIQSQRGKNYRRPENRDDALLIARVAMQQEIQAAADAAAKEEADQAGAAAREQERAAAKEAAQREKKLNKDIEEANERAALADFAHDFAAYMDAAAAVDDHNQAMIAVAQKLHDTPYTLQDIEIGIVAETEEGENYAETEIRTIVIEIGGYDPDPAPGYKLEALEKGRTRGIRFRRVIADHLPTHHTPTKDPRYAKSHKIRIGYKRYYVHTAPGLEINTEEIERTLIKMPQPPELKRGETAHYTAKRDLAGDMIEQWQMETGKTYAGLKYVTGDYYDDTY